MSFVALTMAIGWVFHSVAQAILSIRLSLLLVLPLVPSFSANVQVHGKELLIARINQLAPHAYI